MSKCTSSQLCLRQKGVHTGVICNGSPHWDAQQQACPARTATKPVAPNKDFLMKRETIRRITGRILPKQIQMFEGTEVANWQTAQGKTSQLNLVQILSFLVTPKALRNTHKTRQRLKLVWPRHSETGWDGYRNVVLGGMRAVQGFARRKEHAFAFSTILRRMQSSSGTSQLAATA